MSVKIGDLTGIGVNGPEDNDIFVLNDFSEGETKKVTFAQIKDNIIDPSTFTTNPSITQSIIDSINGYSQDGINSTQLDGLDSTYFLDYTNLNNRPAIPDDDITQLKLSTLLNDSGFVQFDNSTSPNRLIYQRSATDTITYNPVIINTKYIAENPDADVTDRTGNQTLGGAYYTDARVETFLNSNFDSFYTQYTATFDERNIKDSLYEVDGTFVEVQLDQGEEQSQFIRVSKIVNGENISDNFSVGQTIRVYGGSRFISADNDTLTATFSVSKSGLEQDPSAIGTPDEQTPILFKYKICEFDYSTGEITPTSEFASSDHQIGVTIPGDLFGIVDNVYQAFNSNNFVKLTFDNTVFETRGVAVYRQVDGVDSEYKLITVLGPKELATGQWIDYYDFDYVTWAADYKSDVDNSFTKMVHFPLTAHGTTSNDARRGWEDVTITAISVGANTFDLKISDVLYINADANCDISHNDTSKIRTAITSNNNAGRKTITLNAKTYVSSVIDIPDEFGVNGVPYITKIAKLPWSGFDINSNNLIRTSSNLNSRQTSIIGFDLSGTSPYQVQFVEDGNSSANYLVNFGTIPLQPFVDRVRILDTPGGGFYASSPIDLRLINTEAKNSGVSDRYEHKPLNATGGQNITVTSNTFENFTDNVDVSVTTRGVVSGNIISNCGSGLLIYGSTFLISNPNVLVGPAGEYLAQPDILNSVFDSINIDLTEAYNATTQYQSDVMRYQENGANYDLTFTDSTSTPASRVYEVKYIQKLPNGVEEFWTPSSATPITIDPVTQFDGDEDATDGLFAFTIPYASIADFKEASGSNSYTTLLAENANHVGLIYTISNTNEVAGGTIGNVIDPADSQLVAEGETIAGDVYRIEVTNLSRFVTNNTQVVLSGHNSFNPNGISEVIGVVQGNPVTPVGSNVSTVNILFDGATSLTAGSGGNINIVNKFLLAQGRIF